LLKALGCQRAIQSYQKIQCAHEETRRLNVEVRRLRTWISDEAAFLMAHATHFLSSSEESDVLTGKEIQIHLATHNRVSQSHLRHILAIEALPGFSGVPENGVRKGGVSPEPPILPSTHPSTNNSHATLPSQAGDFAQMAQQVRIVPEKVSVNDQEAESRPSDAEDDEELSDNLFNLEGFLDALNVEG